MFCPNCKNQLKEDDVFCNNCGVNVTIFNSQNQPVQTEPVNNQYVAPSSKNRSFTIVLIVLITIVVITVTSFIIVKKFSSNNNTSSGSNRTNTNTSEQTSTNTTKEDTKASQTEDYDKEGSFLMTIDEILSVPGYGTAVSGTVLRGRVNKNDPIEIVGIRETQQTVATRIEAYRKEMEYAEAGDTVNVYLRGIMVDEIERGQVLAKDNTIKAYKKFECDIELLSKDEGGRSTPFFSNYRPQFYFRNTDITGVITLPEGTEMVKPGEIVKSATVELLTTVALEVGTEFSIREGGRTVGSGKVTKIY